MKLFYFTAPGEPEHPRQDIHHRLPLHAADQRGHGHLAARAAPLHAGRPAVRPRRTPANGQQAAVGQQGRAGGVPAGGARPRRRLHPLPVLGAVRGVLVERRARRQVQVPEGAAQDGVLRQSGAAEGRAEESGGEQSHSGHDGVQRSEDRRGGPPDGGDPDG